GHSRRPHGRAGGYCQCLSVCRLTDGGVFQWYQPAVARRRRTAGISGCFHRRQGVIKPDDAAIGIVQENYQETNLADQELIDKVQAMVGREYGRVYAWDRVNAPMIRQWCEIMGISNPLYTDPAFARAQGH